MQGDKIVTVEEKSPLPVRLFLIGKIIGLTTEKAKQLSDELNKIFFTNQTREQTMETIILLEQDGEFGVSLSGSNPTQDDYIGCVDKANAIKLVEQLTQLNDRINYIRGQNFECLRLTAKMIEIFAAPSLSPEESEKLDDVYSVLNDRYGNKVF